MKQTAVKSPSGFTLMETLLAIALVGVLLSVFLTVFVPARGMVRQALTRQESERITGVLRAEMSTIRPDEQLNGNGAATPDKFRTPFDKGFYWLLRSKQPSTAIVVFTYRADTGKSPRADGTYPAIPASKSVPGKNTQLISMACPMNDGLHKDDIKDAVGPVFLVRMTQLVEKGGGEYRPVGNPGSIDGASTPEKYVSAPDSKDAWGGAVFYRADFFLMSPPNPARYKGKSWKSLGRPLFSANLSFHR